MKIYYCKICKKRNGSGFSGTRQMVRKHLRDEHLIKGGKSILKTLKREKTQGKKSFNTIAVEID